MSFRKRNVGLSSGVTARGDNIQSPAVKAGPSLPPGVRPSAQDGRSTTSTGTPSLDALLAGHGGLPMGASLLLEENGTTDYAGALLRFYAAEGLVQGQHVYVVGVPPQWGRELPGVVGRSSREGAKVVESEKMKIAWRYERFGHVSARETAAHLNSKSDIGDMSSSEPLTFCHTFDLTKRLVHPPDAVLLFLPVTEANPGASPFTPIVTRLSALLASSPSTTIHRLVIPSLLSPALFPPNSSEPSHTLTLLHSVRALLSTHSNCLTAMITLPLSLFPRSSGLVRWMELLSDGVLELSPFPHSYQPDIPNPSGGTSSQDEPPQGLLRIHRLPILHERGSGKHAVDEDWAFTLGRRKFTIVPFSLPPIEGDTEAQHAAGAESKGKKSDMEF